MNDIESDAELIEDFVVESREALDTVDESLLALESNPGDLELVREIFRRVHSVKGSSGFLGFSMLESVAHAGENLLSKVRDGDIAFSEEIATALLETVDALRSILDRLESTGAEGEFVYDQLLQTLMALRDGTAVPQRRSDDRQETAGDGDGSAAVAPADPDDGEPEPGVKRGLFGQILVEGGIVTEDQLNQALAAQRAGDTDRVGTILVKMGLTTVDEIEATINSRLAAEGLGAEQPTREQKQGESSIRVDVELLDGIVGLVGELVLTRNQLVQAADDNVESIGRRTQELAYITSSLQEQALRTRMQRIENAWRSLPRVVRDVAKEAGKQATLEMTGEGIELDRTIIEAIRDPLVHLVRNAVDHGLESPEVREAHGKAAAGKIRLSAIQDGGHVIIEVADDGAGIDPEKIAESALSKRLVTIDELVEMTPSEKLELILLPGFSTAAAVTKISGRGVGMDVVASNLRDIRGSLEIQSELGKGTKMRLAIPLTLAIVPALVVECADELFAVPQASVLELVRLQGDDLQTRIEWLHSAPVLRLREELMPLIELNEALERPIPERESATIIIVQSGEQPFGLIVDQVTKAEEIVVKPLSRQIQKVGVYAGATVMGDGSAALILDVSSIARKSNLGNSPLPATNVGGLGDAGSHLEPLLTVMVGKRRAGLPTAELERLEKVHPDSVEWSGNEAVVQYRGRLLPLVFVGDTLGEGRRPMEGGQPLRVVVTSEARDVSVGLVVDQVLDVVDIDPDEIDRVGAQGRLGVVGSVVAGGVLTELLDVPALVSLVDCGPLATAS